MLVLAALAALALTLGSWLRPAGPPGAVSFSALGFRRIVVSYDDRLTVSDPQTGQGLSVAMPAPGGGPNDGELVSTGGRSLLLRGGHAWLLPDDIARPPADLGPAISAFPASDPGSAWLWQPGPAALSRSTVLTEVDLAKRTSSGPGLPVPDDVSPSAAVGGDVLLIPMAGGTTEIWDPASGKRVAGLGDMWPPSTPASPLATNREFVVWTGSCGHGGVGCPLHISSARAARTVRPPGRFDIVGPASISPDGRTVAAGVLLPSVGSPAAGARWGVAVIDLATARMRFVGTAIDRGSVGSPCCLHLAWSPSHWLLYYVDSQPAIFAWHDGTRRARLVSGFNPPRLPVSGYVSLLLQ